MPTSNEWIDPKVAVPATKAEVLICSKDRIKIGSYDNGKWWEQENYPYNQAAINPPLFWMPLPKLPT